MARTNGFSQLARLDQLLALLKTSDYTTVHEIAQQLHTSDRTIMRDLNILRNRGVPIDSDVGRGGGIRLSAGWGIGKLAVSHSEAIHLLLSLAIIEKLGAPLSLTHIKSLRQKIILAFPESQRRNILLLKKRILVGNPASADVLKNYQRSTPKMLLPVEKAFFEKRFLNIAYKNELDQSSERTVEPHFLLINWPVWYLMGWDCTKNDIRIFRLDRIMQGDIQKTYFQTRPIKPFLEKIAFMAEAI
ncbi:MAG: WYL domain-containing protein [Alphaproteobacteria bacterium]|nr:WYL domain-containing protein [Alphaproteobacteria bacterium]